MLLCDAQGCGWKKIASKLGGTREGFSAAHGGKSGLGGGVVVIPAIGFMVGAYVNN